MRPVVTGAAASPDSSASKLRSELVYQDWWTSTARTFAPLTSSAGFWLRSIVDFEEAALVGAGLRRERPVVDGARRHVAAKHLDAVQVDDRAVVAQQAQRQSREAARVRDHERVAKIAGDELVGGGRTVADDGRLVAVAVAELRRPHLPAGVSEARSPPRRPLVAAVVLVTPDRAARDQRRRSGGLGHGDSRQLGVEAEVGARGPRLVHFDRHHVGAVHQQRRVLPRVDGDLEQARLIGRRVRRQRGGADGARRHVAAKHLDAVEVDDRAVVPQQAQRQHRVVAGVRDRERATKVGRRVLGVRGRTVADHRRLVAVAVAELRRRRSSSRSR